MSSDNKRGRQGEGKGERERDTHRRRKKRRRRRMRRKMVLHGGVGGSVLAMILVVEGNLYIFYH